jgi:hypothetical protein
MHLKRRMNSDKTRAITIAEAWRKFLAAARSPARNLTEAYVYKFELLWVAARHKQLEADVRRTRAALAEAKGAPEGHKKLERFNRLQ